MCEDCGCQEGNERAYFESHETHSHGIEHSHAHGHEHSHPHGRKEIHVHIHVDGDTHVHLHTDAPLVDHAHRHVEAHEHTHKHGHTHEHEHEHEGTAHVHAHGHVHTHSHEHGGHSHEHDEQPHSHSVVHSSSVEHRTKTIALETSVLAKNDAQAKKNRQWLKEKGVVAVNLISSPGSGKTYLLEKTLDALKGKIPCAVITGDMQTDNDARRMMGKGAPVVQIETRSACHLNAQQIDEQLETVVAEGAKLLFIENVGNLVCPAAFDLGEEQKIALVSVVEGEDKPVKYPVLFHGASVVLFTKTDLLPHLDVDIEKYRQSVLKVQPGARMITVSARSGEGMDAWISYLTALVQRGA